MLLLTCNIGLFILTIILKQVSFQGIEKKRGKLQGCERAVVARHEAGHAVVGTAVANLLPGQPRVEVNLKTLLLRYKQYGGFLMLVHQVNSIL